MSFGLGPTHKITPAEFTTQYGNYNESIRTHELDNYAHAYMIILIILFIILIIILVAIAINLDRIGQDLQQRLVIPIIEKMESSESKLASVEARTGEMADRIREWDGVVSDVADTGADAGVGVGVDTDTVRRGNIMRNTYCS